MDHRHRRLHQLLGQLHGVESVVHQATREARMEADSPGITALGAKAFSHSLPGAMLSRDKHPALTRQAVPPVLGGRRRRVLLDTLNVDALDGATIQYHAYTLLKQAKVYKHYRMK